MRRASILAIVAFVLMALAGTGAMAQAPADMMRYLPSGQGVVLVDFQKILSSDLWALAQSQPKFKSEFGEIETGLSEVGLKVTDLQGVAVAFPVTSSPKDFTIIISGTFNQNDLLGRLRTNEKITLHSEKYKGLDVYSPEKKGSASADKVVFAFLDNSTVAFGPGTSVRNVIDIRAGEKASAAQDEKINSAISQLPAAAVRFAVVPPPSFLDVIQSPDKNIQFPDFTKLTVAFGTIDVGTGLDMNIVLRNDTAEHAGDMSEKLNGLLSMGKMFLSTSDPKMAPVANLLKTITIAGNGTDVKITGNLPREFFAKMIEQ